MLEMRLLWVPLGVVIIVFAIVSAIRTFLLPQPGLTLISRLVFGLTLWGARLVVIPLRGSGRSATLGLYTPISLVLIVAAFLGMIWLGNLLVFYGLGTPFRQSYIDSGSSLSVLGFATLQNDMGRVTVAVIEALSGTLIIALLIGYLPAIYGAYLRREETMAILEAHVGNSDSAVAILTRYAHAPGFARLDRLWDDWTHWFASIGDTHSSLAGILFVHSPQPHRSWITTAGGVLDAAALAIAALDLPPDPQAERCVEVGVRALRQILDAIRIMPELAPQPTETAIHISRPEFEAAYDALARAELPLKQDRDTAWAVFVAWRSQYDLLLITLCRLTLPPPAPWSSDRQEACAPLLLPIR